MKDEYGNEFDVEIKKPKGKIIHTITYVLPKGKTTLKGEYPKLREDKDCAFPERQSCNYGTGFERCPYMNYSKSCDAAGIFIGGNWHCTYEKERKK